MAKTLHRVAVIGGGVMGAGITEVAANAGYSVLLYDTPAEAITCVIKGIRQQLGVRVGCGKISVEQAGELLAQIVLATELNQLTDAQSVIEVASERLEIKKALFNQSAEICLPSVLLTSNTSSVLTAATAVGAKHPERVAGPRPFNPAPVMKLVEVVSGLTTSTEVVKLLCQCVIAQGEQPMCCHSTPDFIVSRVARPYYTEAWRALEEQVASAEATNAALHDGGGFPMGPLALTDLIGQDVNFAVACPVFDAFWQNRRPLPSLLQQEFALAGRLGKKSGHGVYHWPAEVLPKLAVAVVAPENTAKNIKRSVITKLDDVLLLKTIGETALTLNVQHQRLVVVYNHAVGDTAVLVSAPTNPTSATDKAVYYFQQQGKKILCVAGHSGLLIWRMVTMLANGALDALQKRVASAEDIDIVMRLGVNHPHGPLAWGDSLGWGRVLYLLENLQQHYGERRYRPSALLRQKVLMEVCHRQRDLA